MTSRLRLLTPLLLFAIVLVFAQTPRICDAVAGNLVVNCSGLFTLSIGNLDAQPAPSLSQTLTDTSGATGSGSIFLAYGGGMDGDANAFFDVLIS